MVLFLLIGGVCLFLNWPNLVDSNLMPKWYGCIFSITLLLPFVIYCYFGNKKIHLKELTSVISLPVMILCFTLSIYGIAQYLYLLPSNGIHRVTGSFDNPAGFAACLCAGFPFYFGFLTKTERRGRMVSIIAIVICGLSILLSGSRAGILSVVVVCLAIIIHIFRINARKKILICIFLFFFIISLYFIKKDSSDGRLLIWQCSWMMIKEKPLKGYGVQGFKANYMNYQAKYFERNPESKYSKLADNVSRPFNEYLLLLVNYGLTGIGLLFVFIWFVFKSFLRCKNKNISAYIPLWTLLSIAVFALFSYPLRYPFVWIMGILSIVIIIFQANYLVKIPTRFTHTFIVISIPIVIAICLYTYNRMNYEMKWYEIASKSLLGKTRQMLPEYAYLHHSLNNNELFLYNYAAELNVAECYNESQKIAKECENKWADYNLQLLMADNCFKMKDYTEAEYRYLKASAMCPVKFIPFYKLFQMYEINEEKEKMQIMARLILDKQEKVISPTIKKIKQEVKQKII